MSNELTQHTNGAIATKSTIQWTPEQADLIKRTVAKGVSDDELSLFLNVAGRTGLDPFTKQIHAVKRWDSRLEREVMSIQTGIDGFRLIAQRSGKYQGQLGPFWCGDDGKWTDVWLSDASPRAAKVAVLHADFKEPMWAVATWATYAQSYFDKKSQQHKTSPMWQKMPDLMLAKVAESLALRKAFPADLSGLYSTEEMAQAEVEAPKHVKSAALPTPKPKAAEVVDESPGDHVATFGKYKGQRLADIDVADLANYVAYIEQKAEEDQKPIKGQVLAFVMNSMRLINERQEEFEGEPA